MLSKFSVTRKLFPIVFIFSALFLFIIHKQPVAAISKSPMTLTAIGDSLTYGVGDSTKRGGYTYLIKKPLQRTSKRPVKVHNYGVSGDTSGQILHRLKTKPAIKRNVRQSQIIVLTLGGNDVMHALKKYGVKLTPAKLQIFQKKYDQNLIEILHILRQANPRAPVYIYGIYNPYSIYVKQAQGMKKALKQWNQNTEQIATDNFRVHFVDISALASPKKLKYSKSKQETTNPLLYTKDYFHPNDQGYRLMTQKLWHRLQATQKEWRK